MMKKKISNSSNRFLESINETPAVAQNYQSGLTAMGNYSGKVQANNTRLLHGSVDLDAATRMSHPQDSRWDYIIGYNEEAYFIEVHPAYSSEVSTVLNKLEWLQNWLRLDAPAINQIRPISKEHLFWVHTKGFDIPKSSRQYRAAVEKKLKLVSKVSLG